MNFRLKESLINGWQWLTDMIREEANREIYTGQVKTMKDMSKGEIAKLKKLYEKKKRKEGTPTKKKASKKKWKRH